VADEPLTVVTARAGNTDAKIASTIIVLMQPWKIVAVRAARVYVQSLAGLLTTFLSGAAHAAGITTTASDFYGMFVTCAGMAVAPAVMSALWNTVELLNKWDETSPQLRA
jgi:hypothetical protein